MKLNFPLFIILTSLCVMTIPASSQTSSGSLRILMIGAHPDDCDIRSGGTAALFAQMGHQVKFLSLTNGDAGHMEMGGGALARRRTAESHESAKRLGIAEYEVMDNHDGELMPTLENRKDIIRKIREWKADVVISHRTNDYHPDHRYTGVLVQDAAFMVGVPNVAADTPPLSKNPVFLYFEDRFQKPNPFSPDITVDITPVIDKKINALDAHVSQFYEWLPWISNYDGIVPTGKEARKEWLREQRAKPIDPVARARLTEWYPEKERTQAHHIESFEICEYGSQPDRDEILKLFPMLPGTDQ
ncbi:PIG-L family deacetylase [Membranicola marinus]|uniref:PIG-L family deacetylase n=1 Tax=Membranihabitans marinus TaxID=1227546 RepID=A0A953HWM1_9BACT|nr:PIG-L family deacetylase [Membranihabitans marinus]MBY5959511.1 PIG-L family deacetylase [Membranihabitans marinus]